ncbi:MAG: PD40 domain-containing protein [Gemmatimonadota bacterium]|nr:MAG: PD40 domain-containing protein [Gemmatimonadota bacterium]
MLGRHMNSVMVQANGKITVRRGRGLWIACLLSLALSSAAGAQEPQRDSIPTDVRVGILYQPAFRPGIVMPAIAASQELRELADSVRSIVLRDLDYSDRFEVMPVGEAVPTEGPVNYSLWDELGAVWLLLGAIEGSADGPVLRLTLHDVVFRLLQDVRAYQLPALGQTDFRLAVHGAADQVVEWATSSPGLAATRVAYVEKSPGGSEIYVVDSDGFAMRRVSRDSSIALSPAWSPKGDRLAYMSYQAGDPAIYESDLNPGISTLLVDLPGLDMTPDYSPDGTRLGFAGTIEGRTEVFIYNLERRCCAERATFARYSNSLSPSFSPDGTRIAFNSDRLGQLHIFVKEVDATSAELVTPYIYDGSVHNAGPDWSPLGDRIAFHGWVGGTPQIFTVAPDGRGLRQLTQQGRNEDPSWAPDGRHIVFASTRDGLNGLWVLDVVSGRIRRLVRGTAARLPAWSGRLDSPSVRQTEGVAGSNRNNP